MRAAQEAADARKAIGWATDRLCGYGASVTLCDLVWRCLQDAAETMSRLPDRERAWLLSADRVSWPDVWHSAQEKFEAETQRLADRKMSKEDPPSPRLAITDPTAINRMLTVLGWLQWVRAKTPIREKRDKLITLAMAQGQSPRAVTRLMMGDRGESAARMVKMKVINQIAGVLKIMLAN